MPDPADIPSGYFIRTPTNNAIAAAPAIGIGPGSYGTVTQGTSKTTAVTLNAKAGTSKTTAVTLNAKAGTSTTHGAALASLATVQFTMTNSAISATDVVIANQGSGGTAGSYQTHVVSVGAGTSVVRLSNTSGGSLSEAVTINFAVIDTYAA